MRKESKWLSTVFSVLLLLTLFCFGAVTAMAEEYVGYESLDPAEGEEIVFDGKSVSWDGHTWTLGETCIFLDYRLDSEQIADHPYAFNDVTEALNYLNGKNGTAEAPLMLLTAPGVYWVDDPDGPIRNTVNGPAADDRPYGAVLDCDYLYFYGLNHDADNVVFACNRGQQLGAEGNFTLFRIDGMGLKSENVTFGNYANVDLVYALVPELSREKRGNSIAQAQLFHYNGAWVNGDDGVAINTNFVSRLNLCQFPKYLYNCRVESSGHANGGAIYVDCELWFYNTNFSSGSFFNCDIHIVPFESNIIGLTTETYNFGFVDGPGSGLVCIDTDFYISDELKAGGINAEISWDQFYNHSVTTRSYQNNVRLEDVEGNMNPYVIQAWSPNANHATIVIADGSDLLKAYKVVDAEGNVIYNIPNITGEDPFGYAEKITQADETAANIPTTAYAKLDVNTIKAGANTALLSYGASNHEDSAALGAWAFTALDPADNKYIRITDNGDGTAVIEGINDTEEDVSLLLVAKNELGIEAVVSLTVEPSQVETPTFTQQPALLAPADGQVVLDYKLSSDGVHADQSIINWYRCSDAKGSNPIHLATSRLGNLVNAYTLTDGEIGSYLLVTIEPACNRSEAGEAVRVMSANAITEADVTLSGLDLDVLAFPTDPQAEIIPGAWTLTGYFSPECYDDLGVARYEANPNSWAYSAGEAGSMGYMGLNETARGAMMYYQPRIAEKGNMSTTIVVAPDKSAGQGFGSATDQFMDLFIKFDAATMSGYAFRLQRLNNDAIVALGYDPETVNGTAGVAASLVKYENGEVTYLTDLTMTSAFHTECTISVEYTDGVLHATMSSTKGDRSGDLCGYAREVDISAEVTSNDFGGTGLLFTGTVGSNSVLILNWNTEW